MKTIEIRRFDGENRIFIDNQLFDWGIDENAIQQINQISNPDDLLMIHENIRQYFLQCLESYIGKKLTIKQVYEALKSGSLDTW